MIRALQNLSLPARILIYAVAAAAVLAIAAGIGATAAFVLRPEGVSLGGEEPQPTAQETSAKRAGEQGPAAQGNASEEKSSTEYLNEVADIQNSSVEVAIKSNEKLVRYDSLTAEDIGDLEANYGALKESSARVEELNPPEEYKDQYKVFVFAIDSLRNANELAYRLAADPASATQADFEAYDRQIDRATSNLQRSNEMLDRNYKTTNAAQEISFG